MGALYEYEGNVVLSVSGGLTSGMMPYGALQAHNWELPDNWLVVFANTGKERPETLRFVQEMSERWNVTIHWLEWRDTPEGFEEVGPNSASRDGEPFAALIDKKQYLPNAVTRFCTEFLKVKTIKAFLLAQGWTTWTNLVGLRHDEGLRILKRLAKEDGPKWKEPYRSRFPLDKARVGRRDVAVFWARQDFTLGIPSYDGNCDGCFLKSDMRLRWTERTAPGTLGWWSAQEQRVGARFVTEYSYSDLERWPHQQPLLIEPQDDADNAVECGDACETEAA